MDASTFEKLSVAELSHFLTEKGVPATFCKAFEGIANKFVYVHTCVVFLFLVRKPCQWTSISQAFADPR